MLKIILTETALYIYIYIVRKIKKSCDKNYIYRYNKK